MNHNLWISISQLPNYVSTTSRTCLYHGKSIWWNGPAQFKCSSIIKSVGCPRYHSSHRTLRPSWLIRPRKPNTVRRPKLMLFPISKLFLWDRKIFSKARFKNPVLLLDTILCAFVKNQDLDQLWYDPKNILIQS